MKKLFTLLALISLFLGTAHAQWQKTSDTTSTVKCFAIKDNHIYAGNDSTVLLSTDHGTNWTIKDNGLPPKNENLSVLSIFIKDTNIFAGIGDQGSIGGMYRSTDEGNSWEFLSSGLPNSGMTSVNAFGWLGNRIFVGCQNEGIYYSDNNGNSWTYADHMGYCPFVFATKDSTVFTGIFDKGIFRSTNNGLSWNLSSNGIPYSTNTTIINSIAIKGSDIYASTLYFGLGIYKSIDDGLSWTSCNNGFPASDSEYNDVWSVVASGNNLFAGIGNYLGNYPAIGGHNVYLSTNDGGSWSIADAGMQESTIVMSLFVDDQFIYAGTYKHGIWKRSLTDFMGIANYNFENASFFPNPASDNITITTREDNSEVDIYDITGELMRKETIATNGIISINDLSAGVYVIRISGEKTVYTGKLIKK